MIMLAVLGWCAVSAVVTCLWAAVCSGARAGEARNVPAWRRPAAPERVVPDFLPAARTATADRSLAV